MKNQSTGITLPGAVFIVFLILKLCDINPIGDWSWWWVTSPLWISFGIFIVLLILYLIALFLADPLGTDKNLRLK